LSVCLSVRISYNYNTKAISTLLTSLGYLWLFINVWILHTTTDCSQILKNHHMLSRLRLLYSIHGKVYYLNKTWRAINIWRKLLKLLISVSSEIFILPNSWKKVTIFRDMMGMIIMMMMMTTMITLIHICIN